MSDTTGKVMYRLTKIRIQEFNIEKETDCFIFYNGGTREAKRSNWQNWFNTVEEAKNHAVKQAMEDEGWAELANAAQEVADYLTNLNKREN